MKEPISFSVNGSPVRLEVAADTPLLWVLREQLLLMGTKFGCGAGLCGACNVHINGGLARSCLTPVGAIKDAEVTTIEGLATDGEHPVVKAWLAESVPQCGYCQPGQIMAASALLATNPAPDDGDIDRAMDGSICRCGTYPRIRRAIRRAARLAAEKERRHED